MGQKFQNNRSDYHSVVDEFSAKERVVEKVYSKLIESGNKVFESVKKSTSTSGKILELFDPVQKSENCHEKNQHRPSPEQKNEST